MAEIKIIDAMNQEVTDVIAEPTHVRVSLELKMPSASSESLGLPSEAEPEDIDNPPSSVQSAPADDNQLADSA